MTKPNIKITAKQMRFVFDSGKVWMIQPLHLTSGVPDDLRGNYSVPLNEQQKTRLGEPERQARSPDSQAVGTQRVQALTPRELSFATSSSEVRLAPEGGPVLLTLSSSAFDPKRSCFTQP